MGYTAKRGACIRSNKGPTEEHAHERRSRQNDLLIGRSSLRRGKRGEGTEADGSGHNSQGCGIRQASCSLQPESLTLIEFGTYQRTCGFVGADVVEIPGHSEKPGNIASIGWVRHVHSPL